MHPFEISLSPIMNFHFYCVCFGMNAERKMLGAQKYWVCVFYTKNKDVCTAIWYIRVIYIYIYRLRKIDLNFWNIFDWNLWQKNIKESMVKKKLVTSLEDTALLRSILPLYIGSERVKDLKKKVPKNSCSIRKILINYCEV